jgi:hypothetical protein
VLLLWKVAYAIAEEHGDFSTHFIPAYCLVVGCELYGSEWLYCWLLCAVLLSVGNLYCYITISAK